MDATQTLEHGRTALLDWRWEDARRAFESVLSEQNDPHALAGLGDACFWTGDVRRAVECRERAYAAFRHAGDRAAAVDSAIWLCVVTESALGERAVARGWLARAGRVLGDLDAPALRGWLSLLRTIEVDDLEQSRAHVEQALEVARRCGDTDLELCALSQLGLILVRSGDSAAGLRCVDEAMAGALAREGALFDTIVFTSCSMLTVCDLLADLERAAQWCRAADEVTRAYGSPYLYSYCRVVYGRVLVMKGYWGDAERELLSAVASTREVFPAMHARSVASLADLRLRQGRFDDAAALLAAIDAPVESHRVQAVLERWRGDAAVAVVLLEHWLHATEAPAGSGSTGGELSVEVASARGLLVEAYLEQGLVDAASRVAQQLTTFAAERGSTLVAAHAALAKGHVAMATGPAEVAVQCLDEAQDRFTRLTLPLEAARARLEGARAIRATEPAFAVIEARGALAAFDRLGATGDADRAAALLRTWGAGGRTGPRDHGVLTRREEEVLDLLARGYSNPEIAERLVISRKTASHHVSNLLAKLNVRNRAEAAAYASRVHPEPFADAAADADDGAAAPRRAPR